MLPVRPPSIRETIQFAPRLKPRRRAKKLPGSTATVSKGNAPTRYRSSVLRLAAAAWRRISLGTEIPHPRPPTTRELAARRLPATGRLEREPTGEPTDLLACPHSMPIRTYKYYKYPATRHGSPGRLHPTSTSSFVILAREWHTFGTPCARESGIWNLLLPLSCGPPIALWPGCAHPLAGREIPTLLWA